jgi:hypothetical protein
MVFFALTNITLDVTLGVTWWVVKNTIYGTYCLGSYLFCTTEPPKDDKDILELKFQIAELNKKLDRINSVDNIQPIADKPIVDKPNENNDDAFVIVDE